MLYAAGAAFEEDHMKSFYVRFIRRNGCGGEANHASFQQALSPLGALRNASGAHCDDVGYDLSDPHSFDAISESIMDVMVAEVRQSA